MLSTSLDLLTIGSACFHMSQFPSVRQRLDHFGTKCQLNFELELKKRAHVLMRLHEVTSSFIHSYCDVDYSYDEAWSTLLESRLGDTCTITVQKLATAIKRMRGNLRPNKPL